MAILLGLYEWEVDKSLIERPCREAVRKENAAAYDRARRASPLPIWPRRDGVEL